MRALILVSALLATSAWADAALWARLKAEPNLMVLMRHADTGRGNPLHWDESGNCRGEVPLSARGRDQAKKIGELFAAKGIAPAVISSPMCRCRETAQLAFGDRMATDPLLREIATADEARAQAFERKAQEMIAAQRGKAPVVFVSHQPNIERLTLESIDKAEAVVARANEKGEVEVLGRMALVE